MGFQRGLRESIFYLRAFQIRDIKGVGGRLHCVVVGDAQHGKVDWGGEASSQSASFAPSSSFWRTAWASFGAGGVLEALVEGSLEELLVRLAHVNPVMGAGVFPQAADGADQLAPHQFQLASRLHWFAPVHTRQHGRLSVLLRPACSATSFPPRVGEGGVGGGEPQLSRAWLL